MKNERLAFLGGGVMTEAIIKGILGKSLLKPKNITVVEPLAERCQYFKETYGVDADFRLDALKTARNLLLAVKPQVLETALNKEAAALIPKAALVISIIAGKSIVSLNALLPGRRIIRVMPNTPLAVGAGMSVFARSNAALDKDIEFVRNLFAACGEVMELAESQMDAVTGLSGSGPGYLFVIIDALADAGVMVGLPRAAALKLAAQTVAGSGQMVLETGAHPAALRDQVTSPGGTTIAGIAAMEETGVRYGIIRAVLASVEKSRVFSTK
jgi:pyrroline-5-carboxylate reductase